MCVTVKESMFRLKAARCLMLAYKRSTDAILFHQRSFDFNDLPKKRKPNQRYIHWIIESAQYLYMDIHKLNGIFNWTMTYRQDSDFYLPYGRFHKIKNHPEGEELKKYIKEFGLLLLPFLY